MLFNFPSSATNASFVLRKYYISLLFHYERLYYFKAKYWTPPPGMCGIFHYLINCAEAFSLKHRFISGVLQEASRTAAPTQALAGYILPPPGLEATMPQPQRIETTFPEGKSHSKSFM